MELTVLKKALEKSIATNMPNFASHLICLKKHDLAIKSLIQGFSQWTKGIEDEYGSDSLEIIKKSQYKVGYDLAKQIKEDYQLGDEIEDAVDLMKMFVIPFGIKMKVKKIDENRIREEKLTCPIYDVFKSKSLNYCEVFCLSMTKGWLDAINPKLDFKMVRTADKNHYCIKDITYRSNK